MTRENLIEMLSSDSDEFLKFKRIPEDRKLSKRPDLCAFMLLDRLVPGDRDMVGAAEHDQIWLDVDEVALAAAATEDDVLTLIRCGVRWDSDTDCLGMFT